MNKKIAILALALCMVAAIAVTGTIAYFTDSDAATNTFTVGNVDIDLSEPNWEETGKKDAEDAYPGEPLAKDPTVTNIGSNPCFVRIKVTGLDQFVDTYGEGATIDIRNTAGVRGACNEGWEIYGDYIYYKTVLPVGETTKPAAFDYIVIPEELTNVLHGEGGEGTTQPSYDVNVYAEAVQAQGARPSFSAVEAMKVDEIAAWFATCGM